MQADGGGGLIWLQSSSWACQVGAVSKHCCRQQAQLTSKMRFTPTWRQLAGVNKSSRYQPVHNQFSWQALASAHCDCSGTAVSPNRRMSATAARRGSGPQLSTCSVFRAMAWLIAARQCIRCTLLDTVERYSRQLPAACTHVHTSIHF
jgi:hypothetical protein